MEYLAGKKTYIIAGLSVAWAIVGGIMGWIEWPVASQIISGALLACGIRIGIK